MTDTGYDRLGEVKDKSAQVLSGAVCAQYASLLFVLAGAILVGRLIHPVAAVLFGVIAALMAVERPLAHIIVDENSYSFDDMTSYLVITLGVIALMVVFL